MKIAGRSKRALKRLEDYNTSPERGRSNRPRRNGSTTSRAKAPSSSKDERRNRSSSTEGESGSEWTRFSKSKVGSGKRSADQRSRNSKEILVLGLSLLLVETMSRQKLQDPPAEKMEREHVPHQRKPNPVQKGCVFLKAKMAPTEDLLIKVLAILTKGLALGLSLFPVMIGSRRTLLDQKRLAKGL